MSTMLRGYLTYMPQKGAFILKKLLDSAVANARQKKYVDIDNLYVKNIMVDGGPVMKRFMPQGHGTCYEDTQENKPYHAHPG